MGPRIFYKKPKTINPKHNDAAMDQLARNFELGLIISDQEDTFSVESPLESPNHEVSPKLDKTQIRPFEETTSESDYSNDDDQEAQSHQGYYTQQQVKRSISRTDTPGTVGVTESTLKICASLPKLEGNKGNLVKRLMETLPINSILDLWKRSAIPNGRGILKALGFDTDEINIAELNKVMEEEIANLEDESHNPLMKACLVLQTEELGNLRELSKQLLDENAKLRADNKEANWRISLLAAEIDERHADVIRNLTARFANDREKWSNLNSRLESKLKLFEQEGIKIKTELELVHKENEYLKGEKEEMQKQILESLEKKIDLKRELTEINDINHMEHTIQQFESMAIKRRRDSPSKPQLIEECSRIFKFRKYILDENSTCSEDGGTSGEWMALNFELHNSQSKSTSQFDIENTRRIIPDLADELEQTEEQLNALSPSTSATNSSLEERCIESEVSPKQMQKAYKDFKDNWQAKLSVKRILFQNEDEIYEEEDQEESGKGFAEFMEIKSEFEEQYCIDGRLSPIEGKYVLEQQYADIEAEDEEIRANHKKFKVHEIEDLQSEIEYLSPHLGLYRTDAHKLKPSSSTTTSLLKERCVEPETSLKQIQKAYEYSADYCQAELTEEETLCDKEHQIYAKEQQENGKEFAELMEIACEYKELFSMDARLSPFKGNDVLEQKYVEAKAEEIQENHKNFK